MFSHMTALITGGTGSFGNCIVQFLLKTNVREIRVFSRDEAKQEYMRRNVKNNRVKYYIGDIRCPSSITEALKGVNFVFHAAALKQVPSCELFPMEAIQTNVIGAKNLLEAAVSNRVEKVIMLSTDKAVYPINTMGLTKALMEKLMIAKSRVLNSTDTILCGTRYGNVIGSRGSVIPLFINQLRNGQELTVTDPRMTRFLMSLENSIDLVKIAYQKGKQGDIFVQKAPACTIGDLAEALQELFSLNSLIKIIGTRSGEKMHETLVSREEMVRSEDMDQFYRISPGKLELDYNIYLSKGRVQISEAKEYTSDNAIMLTSRQIIDLLSKVDYIRRELRSA